jgi:DNA primase
MTAEDFLARLDGVKRTARGWSARCPAHGDKSPSLSIREGEDSRILLHCFAGCTPQDICRALGMSMKALFGETVLQDKGTRKRLQKRREAAREKAYRHYLEQGTKIDAAREGELFIKSARNIPDSAQWPDDLLEATLNRLSESYEALWRQEGLDYVV